MTPPPPVTVLMPVYNAVKHLRESMQSILDQTCEAFEFLIVDDGSTDGSRDLLAAVTDPRIRILGDGINRGQTAALNLGLAEARGEYVARQDADDIAHRRRLELQLAALERHKDWCVAGSQGVACDESGVIRGLLSLPCDSADVDAFFPVDNPVIHTAAMFRTRVVRDRLGGYDERFHVCQDYDMWWRARGEGRIANLPQRLSAYRIHPNSLSRGQSSTTTAEAAEIRTRIAQCELPRPAMTRRVRALCLIRHPASGLPARCLKNAEALITDPGLFLDTARERLHCCGKSTGRWRTAPLQAGVGRGSGADPEA